VTDLSLLVDVRFDDSSPVLQRQLQVSVIPSIGRDEHHSIGTHRLEADRDVVGMCDPGIGEVDPDKSATVQRQVVSGWSRIRHS